MKISNLCHAIMPALLFAACDGNGGGSTVLRPVNRDSSGVTISEYASYEALTDSFRIEPVPFLSLGGSQQNAADELDSTQPYFTATSLADGRIVVNDMHRIVFYDKAGKLLYTRGRQGTGPGEFGQVIAICKLPGDTLLVLSGGRDGQVLDPEGNYVRMYPRIRGRASDKCFPDGSFIAAPASDQLPAAAASEKLGPDEQYLVRVKASGEKIADLGKFPVPDYKSDIIREVSIEHTADRIYVGDAKTFEVREQTLDGRLLRILRVAYTPKPVPSNAQPDFVCVEGCATNAPPTALPKTYPVYGRVRADVARRIWIQSYEPRNSWLVFDSTFAFKGILSMPRDDKGSPTEELVGMEKDHVVILRYDKDGAPILAFHRIVHR